MRCSLDNATAASNRFLISHQAWMYRLLLASLLIIMAPLCHAQSSPRPVVVPVWPGVPPGEICTKPESDLPARSDGVHRTTNVGTPTISVYPAPKTGSPTPAMLICPGGGYGYLSINKEGTEIAAWLNSLGITGIVLKYRVPDNRAGALQDAQRAMALIRARAGEWDIDPERLGVIGFSAGGHLAAVTATKGAEKSYTAIDEIDRLSSAANFVALIYPAFLTDKAGALVEQFSNLSSYPPAFIVVTQDDKLSAPGSLTFYQALNSVGAQADLHIFSEGGHGWGLRNSKSFPVQRWPDLCAAWLMSIPSPSPFR